ncbi:hypothetical protein [Roseimicrobium sp. ORNL1]|uniref:hypothetical protein n=1 Tax=Roseimicrobium sp. ORNL1 TaxID=2711231 RepID=UPI0013E1A4B9|nr:hypothetical protein [Roseimicrobium sp. ORNL1]QIF05764.1 hypothetical protein G5S37_31130 [Roseimicrobium sp. ORNL1]
MTAPIVYLSARGQDTVLVAAVVKARLESQGCLVCQGGPEVRSRSQCARHYGPLLQDCDVFIQLIGVDPGPLISSEDDDGFWSLQIWESREAAKRKKPVRHFLLNDDFCRAILPAPECPSHLLKKQARHRQKLASSPAKVRQVRDVDELLRVLPVIRLAGESSEDAFARGAVGMRSEAGGIGGTNLTNSSPLFPPVPGPADHPGMAPTVEAVSIENDKPQLSLQKAPVTSEPVSNETDAAIAALLSAELADEASAPAVVESDVQAAVENLTPVIACIPAPVIPPFPAIQSSPEGGEVDVSEGAVANGDGVTEVSSKASPGIVSCPALVNEPSVDIAAWEEDEDEEEDDPLPGSKPTFVTNPKEKVTAEKVDEASSGKNASAVVSVPGGLALTTTKDATAESADEEEESDEEEDPLPGSKPTFITSLKEKVVVVEAGDILSEMSTAVVNFALDGQFPIPTNHQATESPDEEEDEDEEAPLPGSKPTFHTSLRERVVAEETDDASSEDFAPAELAPVQKERIEIEARPLGRVEIVAQAPMKLELCRTLGHRVSVRPSALERRGLPRRGIPAWMTKRPLDDDKLPVNPVPGERAYTTAPEPKKLGFDDGSEQPITQTLILPNKATFRKYLHHRFLIFRITDSVAVRRRLGEASKRRPGMAIATVLGVLVLLGLLTKFAVDFLDIGGRTTVASSSSTDPALAAPSRLDLTTAARNPNTVAKKQSKQATTSQPVAEEEPSSAAEVAMVAPAATAAAVSAKAGSDSTSSQPDNLPKSQSPSSTVAVQASAAGSMPDAPASNATVPASTSLNLDERQQALESALEEAILAMRSRSKPELYVRENEAKIIELQRNIQELIPVRSGHGFSGSAQSLALSRCLASVQLLGGRRQAARNVLLDLLDTVASTRSASDPEIRLTKHLLRLTNAKAAESGPSLGAQLPLTPKEMETMLARFIADPQWEPSSGEVAAGGN